MYFPLIETISISPSMQAAPICLLLLVKINNMKEEKSKTNGLKPSVELLRLNEQREQMPEGSAGLHLEIE